MNFLPQDYEAPTSSNDYFKLQEGDNKFRILSPPIVGWEDWIDNKPVRFKMQDKPESSFDSKKPIKHFWSFIVWNYAAEKIQIMTITQATIRKSLQTLCESEDWGAPYFYDIKINKKGESIKTEYAVTPLPKKPVPSHVKEAFYAKPINLEALYDSADPFAKWPSYTKGVFEEATNSQQPKTINETQYIEIQSILNFCDPNYRKDVMNSLKTKLGVSDIKNMPIEIFDKIKSAALKNRDQYQNKLSLQEDPFGMALAHG